MSLSLYAEQQAGLVHLSVCYEGMGTPWGLVQTFRRVSVGVYWVDTGGHEGMIIANRIAKVGLSDRALDIAEHHAGWVCFEEDVASYVLELERPEWIEMAGFQLDVVFASEVVARCFPGYFARPLQARLFLNILCFCCLLAHVSQCLVANGRDEAFISCCSGAGVCGNNCFRRLPDLFYVLVFIGCLLVAIGCYKGVKNYGNIGAIIRGTFIAC